MVSDLRKEFQANLLHGKTPHQLTCVWLEDDEGIPCWSFITYPDITNHVTFNQVNLEAQI